MALNVERIYLPDDDTELDAVLDVSEDWVVGRMRAAAAETVPPVLFVGGVSAASGRRRATDDECADTVIQDAVGGGSAA